MSFHYSLTSKSLIVCRPGFEGCGFPWRESPSRPLLLLAAAVVPDGHKVVLEVGEVGAEVVAGSHHLQLLARVVDVALKGRGHDDASVEVENGGSKQSVNRTNEHRNLFLCQWAS